MISLSLPARICRWLLYVFILVLLVVPRLSVCQVLSIQWWQKGTLYIVLESKGTNPLSLTIVGNANYQEKMILQDLKPGEEVEGLPEEDERRKRTVRIILNEDKGHAHFLLDSSGSKTGIIVSGKAPNGGVLISKSIGLGQVSENAYQLLSDSPYGVLGWLRDDWQRFLPSRDSDGNSFFNLHDELINKGVTSDQHTTVFTLNNSLVKESKVLPSSSDKVVESSVDSGGKLYNAETFKTLKGMYEKASKENSKLGADTPVDTVSHMRSFYGDSSKKFIEYMTWLEQSGGFLNKTIPLFYFLQGARLAGSDNYYKLPDLGVNSLAESDVNAFFSNPDYNWPVPKVNLSIVGAAEAAALKTAIESSAETSFYDEQLMQLLKVAATNMSLILMDEVKVEGAWITRRAILKNSSGDMNVEVRIYQVDDSKEEGFKDAIKAANILLSGGGSPLVNPLWYFTASGLHFQIVKPEYYYFKDSIRTFQDFEPSRNISWEELLGFIEYTLKSLSMLHEKHILVDYIKPSQIMRKYSSNKLDKILFLELKPGLRTTNEGQQYTKEIQQNLFQVLEVYYFLRAKEHLSTVVGKSSKELLDDFFYSEMASRSIWDEWISKATGGYAHDTDYEVVELFHNKVFDWGAARKIAGKISGMSKNERKPLEAVFQRMSIKGDLTSEVLVAQKKHQWCLTCENQHPLKMVPFEVAQQGYDQAVLCNQCSKVNKRPQTITAGSIMRCGGCQYDLCGPCSIGAFDVVALPPEVKCLSSSSGHPMTLSQPLTGRRKCDLCDSDITGCHHYRCNTCYQGPLKSDGPHGYDYCLKCAFDIGMQEAKISLNGKQMSFRQLPSSESARCSICKHKYCGEGARVFEAESDIICPSCASNYLDWFGPYSHNYPPVSALVNKKSP